MTLSLAAARRMLDAGLATASGHEIRIGIAIVDPAGYLIAAARMDGAQLMTIDIATGKATAAALFRRSTTELGERWAPGAPIPLAMAIQTNGRFVASQGGLPAFDEVGELLAGVGASGGPKELDEAVSAAAVAALGDPSR